MSVKKCTTTSVAETEKLGGSCAKNYKDKKLFILHGNLGAGKTAFVRGFARFYKVAEEIVASPTFAYYSVYSGTEYDIYHFDLYRIAEGDTIEDLYQEITEILDNPKAKIIIEWGSRLPLSFPCVDIAIEHADDENTRLITIEEHA